MTLGIDVSRLFSEMVMAVETRDLVVKKMVYHYLCNYAREMPDLALMYVHPSSPPNNTHTHTQPLTSSTAGASTRSSATAKTKTQW